MTLHDLAASSHPVGIVCDHCMHRVLRTAAELRATKGDQRSLQQAGIHCGRCGSRRFDVIRFDSVAKARAFMRNV